MIDTIKDIINTVKIYESIRQKANQLYAQEDFTQFTKDELVSIVCLAANKMCEKNREKRELIKSWTLELEECKKLLESENKA